jgi:hypothetical protein
VAVTEEHIHQLHHNQEDQEVQAVVEDIPFTHCLQEDQEILLLQVHLKEIMED